MSARWKAVELEICRLLQGSRSGAVGKEGPDCTDIEHLAVQIKHGKQIPKRIQSFMEQTEDDAPTDKLPLLIMHAYGTPIKSSLVVLRLQDYIDWYVG